MESDVLERAEAAWVAGNDEVQAVEAIPRPIEPQGGSGPPQLPDSLAALGALSTAAGGLAQMLGLLRTLITAARNATAARNHIERAVEVQIETVAEQTRKISAMRFRYHEHWQRPGQG